MSNSYQRVPSDGTMVLLDISIDYLDRDEITVYFDDVLTTAWIWSGTSDKRILFPSPVPNGVVVMVKRTTDASKLRHVFSEGAKFTAPNLDEDLKQALHMAQEASEANLVGDFFTDINLHGYRLYNVGPAVDDTDALTLGQYKEDALGANAAKVAAEAAAAQAAASAGAVNTLRSDLADTSTAVKGSGLVGFTYSLSYATGTIGRWLKDLSTGAGSSFVGFIQSGVGAVVRSILDKLRERPSVSDYGTFTQAQTAHSNVLVPPGEYAATAGLNSWQFYGTGKVTEPGRDWEINPFPMTNGTVRAYKTRTFGNYENATGLAFSINSPDGLSHLNTQILGTSTAGLASTYTDRDHVGMYGQAWSYQPDETTSGTTYTSTSLTDSSVATLISANKLRVNMIIDTMHATPYTGRVQSWSGSTIVVDGWYLRGTGAAGTPANGTGCVINPNSKVWIANLNLFVQGNAGNKHARTGTGIELGVSCDPAFGTNVWGYDCLTLGTGTPEAHFISRGARTYAYRANTGATYAFASISNNRGFRSDDDTLPIEMRQGGVTKWTLNSDGSHSSMSVKTQGSVAAQCTNAAWVNIGPAGPSYGGMYWVSGFNTSGGAEANFVLMVRNGLVVFVGQSDGSGLAIGFQAVGRQLQIKCGNAGTFQFIAHAITA